jgi:signal transduction histidine kinase
MKLLQRARPTASLFVQLFTLTTLTLAAAECISLFLIFTFPPPVPDFYRLSEIEQSFRGVSQVFTERRPLELRVADEPSGVVMDSHRAPTLRAEIARGVGVSPSRVAIFVDRNPLSDRRVARTLRDRMERQGVREEHFLVAPFEVAIRRPDGKWNVVRPQPAFGLTPWQQRILLWFVLSALAMAPISFIFARRLSAPIRLFADAAERLGRDPRAPALALKGSAEIGTAVRAFNDMQERLRRYVEDRTAMVGAIAHDLRTPLTRLRFRIEALPDDQKAKIEADLDQMEAMISAALTFVRDASQPGERTPLELSSLVESLCDEMSETGAASAEIETGEKVVLEGDPMALRRLFANLLDNAVKFGGGRARARVFRQDAHAVVEIDDDGPGIPAQDAERVFEPFYRREPSRNRQTGGAGLGLAIVRSIARGHGGDVALVNRRGGGLTARVLLPL